MKLVTKIFKISLIVIVILLVGFLIAINIFLKPKSDKEVLEKLTTEFTQPTLKYNKYKGFEYRVVEMQQKIDTTLPTLVFVHGSPGSLLDYKKYLTDSALNTKANLIAYDRVGYGPKNLGDVQASLAFEVDLFHDLIKDLDVKNVIPVGYSYGGPVVMASDKNYKHKVTLAGAMVGEYEPMFWVLNFTKWKLTKWMLPPQAIAASKEKYAHVKELPDYKNVWNKSTAKVLDIHGDKDWIVPYKNSEFLEKVIDEDKFTLQTLKDGGHDLIWTNFDTIKSEILKLLD